MLKREINDSKLQELYESEGISPELISETAKKLGKQFEVPADFYSKMTETAVFTMFMHGY